MPRLRDLLPPTLLAVPMLLLAACGFRADSPRALYDEFARRLTSGDVRGTWALVSADGKRRWTQAVADLRDFLKKNPNNPKAVQGYYVSQQEFMTLSPEELWCRARSQEERVLLGAKVVDEGPAPGEPGVVQLDIESALGQVFRWFVHEDGSEGWRYRNSLLLRGELPGKRE